MDLLKMATEVAKTGNVIEALENPMVQRTITGKSG